MLEEPEAAARFAALQARLAPLWRSIREMTDDEQTIVVVPSMSVDVVLPGALQQAMEERFLFLLLLLRQPRARLVYVTSQRIHPSVVEYYLDLLPGRAVEPRRRRLHLLAPEDGTSGPLSAKLLARPRLLAQIRALIADPHRAHLVPYATTEMERDLALELGIPLYGADPKYLPSAPRPAAGGCSRRRASPTRWAPKACARWPSIVAAVRGLRQRRPGLRQAIVKLNEGVSGLGNALVDLAALPPPGSADEPARSRPRCAR